MRGETRHVRDHRLRGFLVVLAFGQVQQFAGLAQPVFQAGDAVDVLLQAGTLATQGLGVFGVVPDVRVLEFPVYFFQALALGIVVKDTPEAKTAVPGDRRCAGGWG
jgi:hypothetical protein